MSSDLSNAKTFYMSNKIRHISELPAMLGQPHRTTRFDRLTTDICRTNGES